MKKFLLGMWVFILLLTLLHSWVFPLEGMVTRLEESGTVIINKGLNAEIQPDTKFYVTRMGEPIAIIMVKMVDDYNSICQVVEAMPGKSIKVGDVISTEEFKKVEETPSSGGSSPSTGGGDKSQEQMEKDREKARQQYEKDVNTRYEDVLKHKTQIYSFRRGSGGTVKINAFDIYNLMSTVVFAGPYASFNVWHGVTSAYGIYSSYASSADPSKIRNVQIEITYWDEEYLDAFATYYSYKETVTDPQRVESVKQNIYRQKGLDKFYVFQIKIINPGPGAFQLAPFPWHCYLKVGDQRMKSASYDEVLDKALNPQQVVNGYIYFEKYDKNGQPILSGKSVTLILEDILGNSKEVTFQ